MKIWKAIYVGDEFPGYYGWEVDVWDDRSKPNFPCYTILMNGEEIDNIDDDDLEFID